MFIFSKDGETVVNSDNVKYFSIGRGDTDYHILVDEYFLDSFTIKDDAIKEMHEIVRQIEAGMTSYQLR